MGTPAPLRTIVVATDFSDNAGVALAWGKEIARRHGALLVLAHAAPPETLAAPEFVPLPPEVHESLHADAIAQLEGEVKALRDAGWQVDGEVVCSHPAPGVLDIAERRAADLIVAGTRGRTGWKRILLGSTAARLVREAPCPVLTVHPSDTAEPRGIHTVLVPTDFSEDAARAADAAARLLGPYDGERRIVLLHAYRVPIDAAHVPAKALLEAIRSVEEQASAGLEALAATLRPAGAAVETHAVQGYPAEVILDEAARRGADLIAIATRGRSGLGRMLLGSTAESVLPNAPCPVLTVRGA